MTNDFTQPSAPPPPPPLPPAGAPPPGVSAPAAGSGGGRGCFFYGCLVVCILFAMGLIGAGVMYYNFKKSLNPKPLEVVELTPPETTELDRKLEVLRDYDEGGREGEAPEGADRFLRLTEREINGLLSRDPETRNFLRVDFEPNEVRVVVNIPLDPQAAQDGKGKQIRVEGVVEATFADRKPVVRLSQARFAGITIPGAWMREIKNQNLMDEILRDNPETAKFLEGIESFEITDDAVEVMLRK